MPWSALLAAESTTSRARLKRVSIVSILTKMNLPIEIVMGAFTAGFSPESEIQEQFAVSYLE